MKIPVGRYPSKTAALSAIREILYRYPIGATLSDEDAVILSEILALHRQAQQKIGCGVASFQVEQNEFTRSFYLTRVDGSRTDFSFIACITPPTPEKEAIAGFRQEVHEQISTFRYRVFEGDAVVSCALTGVRLFWDKNTHIDHEIPFETLLADFLTRESRVLGSIEVNPTEDLSTETWLRDRALAQRWSEYHREHAKLRAVSASANLGRKR